MKNQVVEKSDRRSFLEKFAVVTCMIATGGILKPLSGIASTKQRSTGNECTKNDKPIVKSKYIIKNNILLNCLYVEKKEHEVIKRSLDGLVIKRKGREYKLNGNGSLLWEHHMGDNHIWDLCLSNGVYMGMERNNHSHIHTLTFLKSLIENDLIDLSSSKKISLHNESEVVSSSTEKNKKNISPSNRIKLNPPVTDYYFRGMAPNVTLLN